jgi:hypothetical protein
VEKSDHFISAHTSTPESRFPVLPVEDRVAPWDKVYWIHPVPWQSSTPCPIAGDATASQERGPEPVITVHQGQPGRLAPASSSDCCNTHMAVPTSVRCRSCLVPGRDICGPDRVARPESTTPSATKHDRPRPTRSAMHCRRPPSPCAGRERVAGAVAISALRGSAGCLTLPGPGAPSSPKQECDSGADRRMST